MSAIERANPGLNCNNLRIGQVICIPSRPTTCPSGSFAYTVQPGDTCFSLAQKYDTSVAAIQALNPGLDCNNLRIGQVICIPSRPTTCPPGSFAYTVQPGDTCFSLAQKYDTSVAAIQALNPGLDCNSLRIGQVICIPSRPTTCPPGSFAYTVQPGDTCFSLAQKYDTSVAAIQALNPGLDCNSLRIGQVICIPSRPTTCPPGSFAYTVQPGDTCFSLAQKYDTSVAAIQALNPGLDCNSLRIGQVICIPSRPTTCPPGSFAYTVQPGDTCFSLAQKYDTSVAAIQALNPGLDCNSLRIGQVICIPSRPTTCPPGSFAYTVQPGDTCFSLAQKYDTSVAAIQALNPGLDCNSLRIGQVICLPSRPTTCPPGSFAYTVQPGDTCFSLAQKYDTSVAAIQALNPGLDCNSLRIGQVICIPSRPSACPAGSFEYTVRRVTLASLWRLVLVPQSPP